MILYLLTIVTASNNGEEIKAQICNGAVCTTTEILPFTICEESEEEFEMTIDTALNNVTIIFLGKVFQRNREGIAFLHILFYN